MCRRHERCPAHTLWSAKPLRENVEQETRTVLVHVAGNDPVQWQAEKTSINAGNGENTPGTQRLQQRPEERHVTREDVLDGIQNLNGQCTRRCIKTAETQ